MEAGKKKMLATLVGCNYAGTPSELHGCINDAHAMRAILLDRFSLAPGDVTVLTDDHESGAAGVLPTGANVKRTLAEMVARAAPGDVLFFFFAGHGTRVPPISGHGDRDDEAIVPCDYNLIYVDFRELADLVPRGATFTMVSDSCNSGGLIDQEKEQIGPDVVVHVLRAHALKGKNTAFGVDVPADRNLHAGVHTGRFLPYAAVLSILSAASGVDASHHVADHLLALFDDDASAKYRRGHNGGNHSGAARTDDDNADAGILLSGCQADEFSEEIPADGGRAAYGAFSGALQAVLVAHPAPMSNREVVCGAREVLAEQELEQHPCLYCSDANVDAPFLGQQEIKRN